MMENCFQNVKKIMKNIYYIIISPIFHGSVLLYRPILSIKGDWVRIADPFKEDCIRIADPFRGDYINIQMSQNIWRSLDLKENGEQS